MIHLIKGKRFYLNVYYSKKYKKNYYYFTRKRQMITSLPPGFTVVNSPFPIVKLVVDDVN